MTDLRKLAALYGLEQEYVDCRGERRVASDESLFAVLGALGAHVCYPADVPDALRAKEAELARRRVPRVVSAGGGALAVPLRFFEGERREYRIVLRAEDGTVSRFAGVAEERSVVHRDALDGRPAAVHRVPIASGLVPGYYDVEIEMGGAAHAVHAIAAPPRAYSAENAGVADGAWGVFAPVYALWSPDDLGVGDLRDLSVLVDEVYRRGGRTIGTLPMLAAFLRGRVETSPYRPVSRLYWNELYLDLRALAELERASDVRDELRATPLHPDVHDLATERYVDPVHAMAEKRPVLERLADRFFAGPGADEALARAFARDPLLDAYARFRAVDERQRRPFREWPAHLRAGELRDSDFSPATYRYHVYAQLRFREQLEALSARARGGDGLGLYLDLPLGVHPDGFDVFHERGLFAADVSVGAPPDDFFRGGQDWGFPPLLPEAQRTEGYAHLRRVLATQMRHAGILRLDHGSAIHRLFLVPRGMEPKEGVYLRYPAEEIYGVIAIESHRHRTLVAGEALGTVPPEVRESMMAHGVHVLHAVSHALDGGGAAHRTLGRAVPRTSVACVNTHDMPTFAALVQCHDIDADLARGLLEEHEARELRDRRRRALDAQWREAQPHEGAPLDCGALLRYVLEELGASEAPLVIATLEDLWLEELPQNVPGTGDERPNFRRRLAHALPELFARADVTTALGALDLARRRA